MIKKWVVEHFKSVNEKTELEFAPLTIFAGANSSGKSTIIQSILLTTQTIQSQIHSRPIILNGHILRLGTFNDILSNLSNATNISIGFELVPIMPDTPLYSFQRKFYPKYYHNEIDTLKSINCAFSFSAASKDNEKEKEILQLQPKLESCVLGVETISEDKDASDFIEIRRTTKSITDRLKDFKISSDIKAKINIAGFDYEVTSKPMAGKYYRHYLRRPKSGDVVGSTLQHFLPSQLVLVYDIIEEQSRRFFDALLNPDSISFYERTKDDKTTLSSDFTMSIINILEDFLKDVYAIDNSEMELPNLGSIAFNKQKEKSYKNIERLKEEFTLDNIRSFYRALSIQNRRDFLSKIDNKSSELRKLLKAGKQPEYDLAYVPLSQLLETSADFIQSFFVNQVKYIGPLRDEPKPVYPLAGSVDPRDIGFKGENTAAVLDMHRNSIIDYIPCSAFETSDSSLQKQQSTLINAVLDWMKYMGVAHNLYTIDKGKLGHELQVATIGTTDLHDLTHVGVGVSQVLPILVQSLLSEQGATLVFEQPELHLHPRVQTRLADFFVSMTMLGKQCIVETHSEYLINRLRYRSAVSKNDSISNNTILYFVENDSGHSNYRPIRINKYGVIENWPLGFFDENEETAAETLKAGMLKRQNERAPENAS